MKKPDLNSVIGFVLIGLILIGYSYFTTSQEPPANNTEQVSNDSIIDPVNLQEIESASSQPEVAVSDSVVDVELQQKLGIFYSGVQKSKDQNLYTLENELLRLVFSPVGAKIVQAELKNYKTHDTLPLMLVNENQVWQLLLQADRLYNSSDLNFSVQQSSDQITFTAPTTNGTPLVLSYKLEADSYEVQFEADMEDIGFSEVALEWDLNALRHEKNVETEGQQTRMHYLLSEKSKHKKLSATSEKEVEKEGVEWVAYKQQFFSSILLAEEPFSRTRLASAPLESEVQTKTFASLLQFEDPEHFEGSLFFTPNQYDLLKDHGHDFDKLIPLGGWIFGWINRGVTINVFSFLEKQGLNYGLIIFLMALLIKLVLLPLTYSSYLSMAKMRVLKPEIDELNQKFEGKDAMKKQTAMMELYRKAGVNPLGGCIPVLLQFPILIAVFRFFPASIELRQKSFLWATDLSTYDSILALPFSIPFYGDHVSLFTLLMTVSTLIYTYFNNQLTQQSAQFPQMKYMMYLMPIMFLGFFNNYAAGLSYYYFVSNVLTFSQQAAIRKMVNDDAIHAKLQENKKKPKKQSKFQQRLEQMAKDQQEQGKSNRRMRRQ